MMNNTDAKQHTHSQKKNGPNFVSSRLSNDNRGRALTVYFIYLLCGCGEIGGFFCCAFKLKSHMRGTAYRMYKTMRGKSWKKFAAQQAYPRRHRPSERERERCCFALFFVQFGFFTGISSNESRVRALCTNGYLSRWVNECAVCVCVCGCWLLTSIEMYSISMNMSHCCYIFVSRFLSASHRHQIIGSSDRAATKKQINLAIESLKISAREIYSCECESEKSWESKSQTDKSEVDQQWSEWYGFVKIAVLTHHFRQWKSSIFLFSPNTQSYFKKFCTQYCWWWLVSGKNFSTIIVFHYFFFVETIKTLFFRKNKKIVDREWCASSQFCEQAQNETEQRKKAITINRNERKTKQNKSKNILISIPSWLKSINRVYALCVCAVVHLRVQVLRKAT